MRYDWTDLQVFLHVCEAGSMTAAAARCHLTLAAVSARVRSLEADHGVVLPPRQPRGVVPTPAGELLARHARAVFDQVQSLERDLLHARNGTSPRFVLLANSSALARPWTPAIARLSPDATQFVVRESPSEATVQAIRSGAADVGIVSDAVETRGLATRALGPDPLVLVTPRGHPLADGASVAFEEALAQPWIAWGEQGALSTHLLMRAAALDKRPQVRLAYPRAGGVLELVARGLGVTVLPQAVVDQHAGVADLACIALDEPWARRHLLVCFGEGGDPLREQLADGLVDAWREMGTH